MPDHPQRKRWLRIPGRVEVQAEADVEAELEFHLEMRAGELEAEGVPSGEARRRAEREFGDLKDARQRLSVSAASLERRARRGAALDALVQDIRVGGRLLRANPLFTLVAVLTLALGVGANTAMFGLVNAVLLRPLPYGDSDRLVQLWETRLPEIERNVVSRGNYMDWRDQANSFKDLAAYMLDFGYGLTGAGDPVQVTGSQAAPSLFQVLQTPAHIGRTFTEEEGTGSGGNVVLLSWGFWMRHFGGDPAVLGRVLTIDGTPLEVVGVMPRSFAFPSRETEMWFPLSFSEQDRNSRGAHMLHVVGRLADGVTAEMARAEMAAIARLQAERFPEPMDGWGTDVLALRSDITRRVKPAMLILLAAVGLVLLIACANVANLMLARSFMREREIAVRAALGAGRSRLLRQFLTESGLLAALGGLAGLIIGSLALRVVVALDPGEVPLIETAVVDVTVLGFAVAASAVALFGFALLPAMRSARTDLQTALREATRGAGGGRHGRLRGALLVAEIAVSVVLIVGAGLLLRSMAAVQGVDAGMDPSNVLTVRLNLPVPRYSDPSGQIAFYDAVLDGVSSLPGVENAAGTSEPPIVGYQMTRAFQVDGYAFSAGERDDVYYRAVSPEYFEALRISLIRGRHFTGADRDGSAPVVIVNEAMAERYWTGRDPLGGQIRLSENGPWYEVVGIAGNVRHNGLESEEPPAIYAPFAQKDWAWLTWMTLVIRTPGDPAAIADEVRQAVWTVDPELPIQDMSTLESLYGDTMARRRFTTSLLVAFALLAIVLGAVGVYGVVGYTVAQRTREIGVRMALGAARREVIGMVVRSGLRLTLTGAAAGLVLAVIATRALSGLLFGVEPVDPATYGGALLVVTAVATAACAVPAFRAARVEPLRVLHAD